MAQEKLWCNRMKRSNTIIPSSILWSAVLRQRDPFKGSRFFSFTRIFFVTHSIAKQLKREFEKFRTHGTVNPNRQFDFLLLFSKHSFSERHRTVSFSLDTGHFTSISLANPSETNVTLRYYCRNVFTISIIRCQGPKLLAWNRVRTLFVSFWSPVFQDNLLCTSA